MAKAEAVFQSERRKPSQALGVLLLTKSLRSTAAVGSLQLDKAITSWEQTSACLCVTDHSPQRWKVT